jgi:hypothetical protein
MRLSDSLTPSSTAPVPLAAVYRGHGCLFLPASARTREGAFGAGVCGAGFSSSRQPRGGSRVSRVTGSSCFRRAEGTHPAGRATASPAHGGRAAAFRNADILGVRNPGTFRGCFFLGSHAHVPTHQPARYRTSCKVRYRPAGLGFGRAGFAPAGRLFRLFFGYHLPWSRRTSIARSLPAALPQLSTPISRRGKCLCAPGGWTVPTER